MVANIISLLVNTENNAQEWYMMMVWSDNNSKALLKEWVE